MPLVGQQERHLALDSTARTISKSLLFETGQTWNNCRKMGPVKQSCSLFSQIPANSIKY